MANMFDDEKYIAKEGKNRFDSPEYIVGAKKQSSFIDDALDYAMQKGGIGVRGTVKGVASLPGIFNDPLLATYSMITGKPFVPTIEAVDQVLTMAGVPKAGSRGERIYEKSIEGGVGGGAIAKTAQMVAKGLHGVGGNILRAIADKPSYQAGAALAGTTAAQTAKEDLNAGPMGQLGAAMLLGTVLPGGSAAVGGAVEPFLRGGREKIVGDVLRHFATDADSAATRLAGAKSNVPNYVPTTGPASRDAGLMSLERYVKGTKDGEAAFATRATDNNRALHAHIDKQLPTSSQTLRHVRDTTLAPRITQLEQTRTTVNPQPIFDKIAVMRNGNRWSDQLSRNAIDAAEAELKHAGVNARDPMRLYQGVRKTLADKVSAKYDPINNRPLQNNEIAAYKEIIRTIDETIETGMPGYTGYYKEPYSKLSKAAGRREILENLKTKGEATASYDLNQEAFFQPGRWNQALRNLEQQGKIKQLTPTQRKTVDDITEEIRRGAMVSAGKVPGSETFKNITLAHLIGRMTTGGIGENAPKWVTNVADKFSFLLRMPNEQVQSLLAEAMTDPDLARRLMTLPSLSHSQPLVETLKRRAVAYGYGSQVE